MVEFYCGMKYTWVCSYLPVSWLPSTREQLPASDIHMQLSFQLAHSTLWYWLMAFLHVMILAPDPFCHFLPQALLLQPRIWVQSFLLCFNYFLIFIYLLFWELFFAHKTTLKSYTRIYSGNKVSFHSISFMKSPFAKVTTISSFLSIFWEMAFEFINICTYAHTFFPIKL